MITQVHHTPLTELAKYFAEMKWGGEGILLSCLREGKLIASINYPSNWPSLRKIPKGFWEEIERKDFDVLERPSRPSRKSEQSDEYCLSGEHFFDDEFEYIKAIAHAAVENDISKIPGDLKVIVLDQLELPTFDGFTDWLNLVRIFHEMAQSLKNDSSEDFPVFVLEDDLKTFISRHAPTQGSGKKGRDLVSKRNPYWPELYGQLFSLIIERQQKSFFELTGMDTWGEVSGEVYRRIEGDIEIKPNTKLPQEETFERDIKAFEERGLK